MSRETQRTPASSSFINPVLSSLKLTSPKFDFSSFCNSKSVIEPFFSKISTIDSDMGLGLQTLLNTRVTRKRLASEHLGYRDRCPFFLEPLRKALIPILHVRRNRGSDAFYSIPEIFNRDALRIDISTERNQSCLPRN